MMQRKPNKPDNPPKWFTTWSEDVFSKILIEIKDIKTRLTKIEKNQEKDHNLLVKTSNLLDSVIKLNNLKTN